MPKELICPVPTLAVGKHTKDDEELCFWEAVNVALTGKLSDECPPCVHPAIHALLMSANDKLPHEPRQLLWPYHTRALGTKDRDSVEIAFACADTAIRVFATDAMDSAGLPHEAKILRALPPIDSESAAESARAAAESAAESARSANWFLLLDKLLPQPNAD